MEPKISIFLSTDGKHTVNVEVGAPKAADALRAAESIYDKIVAKYGLKPVPTKATSFAKADKLDQETCPHTTKTVKEASGQSKPENKGKRYTACLDCGKWLYWTPTNDNQVA